MKRELLFRAWDGEKMHRVISLNPDGMYVIVPILRFPFSMTIDAKSIMQFTGKYDSEDNPIYEGDIIEFDRREWGGNDNIFVVTWNDNNAEWCWGGGTTSDMDWRTVIGNIFEHPELLK